ncbi:MAG: DoxX family protein [Hyphomicrobiaceae bacterium]
MNQSGLSAWSPRLLSVLRIVSGLIFLLHGTQKLLGFPPSERVVAAFSLSWYAAIIELVCGTLIMIGLFTRSAAFLASGTMAFAYWIAHAPRDTFPVNNAGDAAILYCFIFLYLVFAGPGPWSVDAMRTRSPEA